MRITGKTVLNAGEVIKNGNIKDTDPGLIKQLRVVIDVVSVGHGGKKKEDRAKDAPKVTRKARKRANELISDCLFSDDRRVVDRGFVIFGVGKKELEAVGSKGTFRGHMRISNMIRRLEGQDGKHK